ncbi:MAG: glycosyltransferase family 4 protein [Desulfovibrionaceae bacterium]
MNIVYVTSSDIKSGGARQALATLQGLRDRGHAVTFFVPQKAQLPLLDPDFNWRYLPEKRRDWGKAIEPELAAMSRQNPFVVHAFHNKAVKLAAWWGLFWRRRGAVMIGHRGVIYKPNNPLPYWSPGLDAFIVNSKVCADIVHSKGVSRSRLHVVYNGIPAERITPRRTPDAVRAELGLTDTDLVIGSVTDDSPNKGVDFLLRSWKAAHLPPNARLLLVGVHHEVWPPMANELGIPADRLLVVGRTECVADYLQVMDAFVVSSHTESMPNALLEGLSFGLPVISTAVGGIPELVDGNGLLVPARDERAMTGALAQLCRSPEQREAWGQRSAAIAAVFSMDYKTSQVEDIYKGLLAARSLPVA